MSVKAIRPENAEVPCAVCGRRLLQGERPEIYLAHGVRRTVCELCTVRANQQGWIRESGGLQPGSRRPGSGERRSRLRWRSRRERPSEPAPPPSAAPDPAPAVTGEPEVPREPRHVHAVPTSDDLKASRALELFNASEHPRTVAGVGRSLGAPWVTIRPDGAHPSLVSIVVAWELCWYRYEVDLADETGNGVRLSEQGYELTELPEEDQMANAASDDRGALVLATAGEAEA